LTNNQKEKIFSNKFVRNFLEIESTGTLKNKYKFSEIASSLAYYLKSFSNINKLLDYICLIFKHIFPENIILIIPGLYLSKDPQLSRYWFFILLLIYLIIYSRLYRLTKN